ncbi:MAG: hypothetical protein P8Y71_11200 [Pseudolabrys sp.]|jgi:hypothetical protein
MKLTSGIIAGALLVASIWPGFAQQQPQQRADHMRVEQQVCESDVYALCGQAIPDQNRIEKCLRRKWSNVSYRCRSAMASYGRRHNDHNKR